MSINRSQPRSGTHEDLVSRHGHDRAGTLRITRDDEGDVIVLITQDANDIFGNGAIATGSFENYVDRCAGAVRKLIADRHQVAVIDRNRCTLLPLGNVGGINDDVASSGG